MLYSTTYQHNERETMITWEEQEKELRGRLGDSLRDWEIFEAFYHSWELAEKAEQKRLNIQHVWPDEEI